MFVATVTYASSRVLIFWLLSIGGCQSIGMIRWCNQRAVYFCLLKSKNVLTYIAVWSIMLCKFG